MCVSPAACGPTVSNRWSAIRYIRRAAKAGSHATSRSSGKHASLRTPCRASQAGHHCEIPTTPGNACHIAISLRGRRRLTRTIAFRTSCAPISVTHHQESAPACTWKSQRIRQRRVPWSRIVDERPRVCTLLHRARIERARGPRLKSPMAPTALTGRRSRTASRVAAAVLHVSIAAALAACASESGSECLTGRLMRCDPSYAGLEECGQSACNPSTATPSIKLGARATCRVI